MENAPPAKASSTQSPPPSPANSAEILWSPACTASPPRDALSAHKENYYPIEADAAASLDALQSYPDYQLVSIA
jgi:hypothetical protein